MARLKNMGAAFMALLIVWFLVAAAMMATLVTWKILVWWNWL
jgi:hypothetical protein